MPEPGRVSLHDRRNIHSRRCSWCPNIQVKPQPADFCRRPYCRDDLMDDGGEVYLLSEDPQLTRANAADIQDVIDEPSLDFDVAADHPQVVCKSLREVLGVLEVGSDRPQHWREGVAQLVAQDAEKLFLGLIGLHSLQPGRLGGKIGVLQPLPGLGAAVLKPAHEQGHTQEDTHSGSVVPAQVRLLSRPNKEEARGGSCQESRQEPRPEPQVSAQHDCEEEERRDSAGDAGPERAGQHICRQDAEHGAEIPHEPVPRPCRRA